MRLTGTDIRAAYFCTSAVIRGRELHNHQVPKPVRELFDRLDAEVRMSRARHESSSDSGESETDGLIGAVEAAAILGWNIRKVQRLATDLDGEKVSGSWVFNRSTVVAYREGLADGSRDGS